MMAINCYCLVILLFIWSRVEAICIHDLHNEKIYTCEGGTVEDLNLIPSNIAELRISDMPVGRITRTRFSRFADDLAVLSCIGCDITDFEDGALTGFKKLRVLDLSYNHLQEIKYAWLGNSTASLKSLDLSNNNIDDSIGPDSIDGKLFGALASLNVLDISGNKLSCIPLGSMTHLTKLTKIVIRNNPYFFCWDEIRQFTNDRGILWLILFLRELCVIFGSLCRAVGFTGGTKVQFHRKFR